jgi:hypothetical protein
MAELAAARAEVEAAAVADAARAAAAELEPLRASSTGSSVSADDDRDNELKLAKETAREQAAQWAVVHPWGCAVAAALTGAYVPTVLRAVGVLIVDVERRLMEFQHYRDSGMVISSRSTNSLL